MLKTSLLITFFIILVPNAFAANNGQALTPPMGWNSWNTFRCNINETVVKQIADAVVDSGMKDAGYQYVVIDDCWQVSRDQNGNILADPQTFPSGMKSLGDYIHAKGLKFGIYSSRSSLTCQGHPGSDGHEQQDANSYASWGVDFVKYDNCYGNYLTTQQQYETMSQALKNTGRGMVFSISAWHFATWMPVAGNMWRTTLDIYPAWSRILEIANDNEYLYPHAKPGAWNDPDMLEVGNGNLTTTENRSHFSLWAIMAAPLITGNDLRNMSPEIKDLLTNSEVISINQDPLGIQGRRIRKNDSTEVWTKPLSDGSFGVLFLNISDTPLTITINKSELGYSQQMTVRDLWNHQNLGTFSEVFSATVASHDSAVFKISQGLGTSNITNLRTTLKNYGLTGQGLFDLSKIISIFGL